jgi:hypothetical protein
MRWGRRSGGVLGNMHRAESAGLLNGVQEVIVSDVFQWPVGGPDSTFPYHQQEPDPGKQEDD